MFKHLIDLIVEVREGPKDGVKNVIITKVIAIEIKIIPSSDIFLLMTAPKPKLCLRIIILTMIMMILGDVHALDHGYNVDDLSRDKFCRNFVQVSGECVRVDENILSFRNL